MQAGDDTNFIFGRFLSLTKDPSPSTPLTVPLTNYVAAANGTNQRARVASFLVGQPAARLRSRLADPLLRALPRAIKSAAEGGEMVPGRASTKWETVAANLPGGRRPARKGKAGLWSTVGRELRCHDGHLFRSCRLYPMCLCGGGGALVGAVCVCLHECAPSPRVRAEDTSNARPFYILRRASKYGRLG